MSLLIETQKDKDWILKEIKKHRQDISIKRSMPVLEILNACHNELISVLLRSLKNDDFEPNVKIPHLTETYHWFYTDIVGSADPAILTKDQARKVWVLYELISRTDTFKQRDLKSDVINITGDGMVIGFSDSPEKPLHLAVELIKRISKYNGERKNSKDKLLLRVGIHTGPVYFIRDMTDKDNFWGPGIIVAKRVMDLARPMQILASERIALDIRELNPENKSIIHEAGVYPIKHGEKIKLYNIYSKDWGNKNAPLTKVNEDEPTENKFIFPKIEVRLEITNTKTMMTHHTWIWNITNIDEKPRDRISYYIAGEKDKKFEDLNLSVKDDKGRKLDIIGFDINKPQEKSFIVKLNKPIKPKQSRKITLEYDWEEPEKKFEYPLPADCKKFKYIFSAPKKFEAKPRVLKVDPVLKTKTRSPIPLQIKYTANKTEVVWENSNLHVYDSYSFEW